MHIIKKIRLFTASFLLLGALITPAVAMAGVSTNRNAVCEGVGLVGGQCGSETPGTSGVNSTIRLVIQILSFGVGIVAVVMIIIGGFKYVTSSGDSSNITAAKNTILYAIVGLVIVAIAQVIVKFTLNKVK